MNQKACVQLEIVKNEKTYIFSVPLGSSYQDSHDALVEIAQGIRELSQQAQDQLDKAKAESEVNGVEEPQGV